MRASTLLVLAAITAPAQADVWEGLHGSWRGKGTVRGMAAAIELEFRPALGGRAHHLGFINRMRGDDGKEWVFEAEATYLCASDSTCRGHWYDSRGAILPLTTRIDAEALLVEWGDATTEQGRTRYAPQPDTSLVITDEVMDKSGNWKIFGTTTARRP
jgi:hypothetical protein